MVNATFIIIDNTETAETINNIFDFSNFATELGCFECGQLITKGDTVYKDPIFKIGYNTQTTQSDTLLVVSNVFFVTKCYYVAKFRYDTFLV